MNVVLFHPEVANDLNEASRWYERQRPGLGKSFRKSFEEILERVLATPLRFPPLGENVRCARLQRFPYAVFYEHARETAVIVYGVLHHSRDPAIWQDRSSSSGSSTS